MFDPRDVETAEFPSLQLHLELPQEESSKVHIDLAALSDPGKVRERNEDHFYVARGGRHATTLVTNVPAADIPSHFEETAYLLVVADGMGGHAGGDVASRLAVATLINIILHAPDWIMRLDDEHAERLMDRAVARYRVVHEALRERARLDPQLKGMGTTMTAAYSLGRDLFITQVGDSRAYRFRDGILQLLTRDQTQAQMLADEGLIRQQDVARHRLRHVLTSALGGSHSQVRAEIERSTLADGDRLLLCSDGLTDMVEDAEIADVLRHEVRSEEACRLLVDRALANGGKDNVTVVLARYSMPD
jgi:PPM family protein phosphatase